MYVFIAPVVFARAEEANGSASKASSCSPLCPECRGLASLQKGRGSRDTKSFADFFLTSAFWAQVFLGLFGFSSTLVRLPPARSRFDSLRAGSSTWVSRSRLDPPSNHHILFPFPISHFDYHQLSSLSTADIKQSLLEHAVSPDSSSSSRSKHLFFFDQFLLLGKLSR